MNAFLIQYTFPNPSYWAALDRSYRAALKQANDAALVARSYLEESPEGDLLRVEKPNIEIKFVIYN